MLVVPAIDIKSRRCVRLFKGDYSRERVYYDDPVLVARMFKDAGIELVHIVDLDGAKVGFPVNLDIVRRIIKDVEIVVEFGGGVRSIETVREIFSCGVGYVIVGTIAFTNRVLFEEMLSEYGKKIVVSLDADNGILKVSGWLKDVGEFELFDSFMEFVRMGINRIIFTDISRDGTLQGVNLDTVSRLVDLKGDSELFVAGGVSDKSDILALRNIGVDGVIVGSAFYNGKISLSEMVGCAG